MNNDIQLNSLQMYFEILFSRIEYIELSDYDETDIQRIYLLNEHRRSLNFVYSKLNTKTSLAILRLVFVYFFYFMDDYKMSEFIWDLFSFLLLHEGMVVSNFIIFVTAVLCAKYCFNTPHYNPSFCQYFDILNNL